jgi:hypothetical protein
MYICIYIYIYISINIGGVSVLTKVVEKPLNGGSAVGGM